MGIIIIIIMIIIIIIIIIITIIITIIIIIIITTRPKPAYGRQGLAGSWGQDTDQAGTFLGVLNHENQPETLKNYKNRPGTMKNQPGANNFQKKKFKKNF